MLEFRGISKKYPGVQALRDVDLTVEPGRVTAIVGENGAGKSTLIKVLSGAVRPDEGEVALAGEPLPSDPAGVLSAGVSVIYQELTDVPDMTVAENVLLGNVPARLGVLRSRRLRKEAGAALARVGAGDIGLSRSLASLPVSQKQLVEIARSLHRRASVIVMDEPTSALAEQEVQKLLEVVRSLRDQGLVVIYVSHNLDDVFAIADTIVVMRDGAVVDSRPTAEFDHEGLVKAMLAKSLNRAYPWQRRTIGPVELAVEGLRAPGVRDVSLEVRKGELVGLVGLAGAGRTEAMKAISGVVRRSGGTVAMGGREMSSGSISAAREAGLFYCPEDRKVEALIPEASVESNMILGSYGEVSSHGWISRTRVARAVSSVVELLRIKVGNRKRPVRQLSGGNQQRVVLGRVMLNTPSVILLDDPTRGVDIGARAGIYEYVVRLAESGVGFLLTSSEIEEVLAMTDRVYVFRAGQVVAEMGRDEFDRERALHLAAADLGDVEEAATGAVSA